ncbi:hypothetical protein JXC34_04985 [Candidatus Woesearchaeota archaeon]|nr:hypothetical protein [Candidatus Woesearchaeota archaeon]
MISFLQDTLLNFVELIYAPVIYPEILWILVPVILTVWVMELYFTKNPRKGIDHHVSLENSVFLIFVSFNLIKRTLRDYIPANLFITSLFIIVTLIITALDFTHRLPLKTKHGLSSKFIIGYLSYVAIVLVYSGMLVFAEIPQVISIAASAFMVFILFAAIGRIYKFLQLKSYEELEYFKKKK